MTNEDSERRMQAAFAQAEEAVNRLAVQISECKKRLDAKFNKLRAPQDGDFEQPPCGQAGE